MRNDLCQITGPGKHRIVNPCLVQTLDTLSWKDPEGEQALSFLIGISLLLSLEEATVESAALPAE